MKYTAKQATTKTLTDLYRALDHQHAVTITYLDRDGTESIRTIEPFDIRTTKSGRIEVRAMCRLRGEARGFALHRIVSYTCHRMAYVLDRPAPTKYVRPDPAPVTDAQALFFYELARDQDDADYTPRTLIQTDTSLAA